MPDGVAGICDPISQHRAKHEKETLFTKTTQALIEKGYVIFDDRPFFKKINELKENWFIAHNPSNGICTAIVDEFFMPLLATRKIKTLLTFPNFDVFYTSYWEGSHAKDYGIKVHELPFNWHATCSVESLAGFGLVKDTSNTGQNPAPLSATN